LDDDPLATVPIELRLDDCFVTAEHMLWLDLSDADGLSIELFIPLEDTPAGERLLQLLTQLTTDALRDLGSAGVAVGSITWNDDDEGSS
jgi:hypothetical protein